MSKAIIFTIIIITSLLNACSSLKRHASATFKGEDSSLADIEIFGYKLYEPHEITSRGNLWDLNATAQANLLEILDRRFKDNESFLRALNNRYTAVTEETADGSYISKNLRLILTVSKKRNYSSVGLKSNAGHPAADRIEYLKIRLGVPESSGIKFTGWNRFATEYADIKIADVSFNTGLELSGNTGISESEPVERSAGIVLKGSSSKEEDQEIAYRYLKINGKLSDEMIEIEEEGTRAIDLTGNIISDISLVFSGFPEKIFIPVFSMNGEGKKTVQLIEENIDVPRIKGRAEPVVAQLEMDYVFRHVANGSRTFQEWDDAVEYYTGRVIKEIVLLDAEDYLPPFQCIGKPSGNKEVIRLLSDSGESCTLKFRNYPEAVSFLKFLYEERSLHGNTVGPIRAGNYTLSMSNEPLTYEDFPHNLTVLPFFKPAE